MGDSYGIWDGCWRRGGAPLSLVPWWLGGVLPLTDTREGGGGGSPFPVFGFF